MTSPITSHPSEFAFVDVFTDVALTGNPLAVVDHADGLSETTMKLLTREFNQVESTFICTPTLLGADLLLRSFTVTGVEVYGAGHNALGAWWYLAARGRLKLQASQTRFIQQSGNRTLPVEINSQDGEPTSVVMTQSRLQFGQHYDDLTALAAALNLDLADVQVEGWRPQVVSTGASHLLIPVRSWQAVDRARPDPARLIELQRGLGETGCYLFSLDTPDPQVDAYTRFFHPIAGITEDPATGTAAGPLACLLRAQGVVQDGTSVVIIQGAAIGRPCRIEVRLNADTVQIAGRATIVAEGVLRLPN